MPTFKASDGKTKLSMPKGASMSKANSAIKASTAGMKQAKPAKIVMVGSGKISKGAPKPGKYAK